MFELNKMLILIGLFRMSSDKCSKTNLRPNGVFKEKHILHGKRSDKTKLSNIVTLNCYHITIFNDSTVGCRGLIESFGKMSK